MLHRFRLLGKIMLVIGVSIVIFGALLTYANQEIIKDLITEAETRALDAHLKNLNNSIAAESQRAESMSALVASIPLVAEKFDAADRQALASLFVPEYKQLAKTYGVEQFQFHTPPATSFLRVHKPSQFGDDLSSFRKTVVDTNKTLKSMRGLESGVAGLGARGMVPVMRNGQHIGSVEFGMSIGQDFFEKFKAQNGVDASLHVPSEEGFKTVASTFGDDFVVDDDGLRQTLDSDKPLLLHREIKGIPHAIYAVALKDYSGNPIGAVEIAMDISTFQGSLVAARQKATVFSVLALALGLVLATLLSRQLVERINRVVKEVNRMAQGDFSRELQLDGNDEIGELARATREMQRQLHDLAKEVSAHAVAVHAAALEISSSVETQAATSTELSWSVVQITSTMEELSSSSSQISENSEAVVDISGKTLENSHNGFDSVQSVLDRIDDIRADNEQSLHEIEELGVKSQQISKVMDMINSLADQTRMIAFNAAIEASSAGESGKRFAVVASEIRHLANRVTSSTKEISHNINDIQESINRLIGSSEKGASSVAAGEEAATFTAHRLNDIVVAAKQTNTAAEQISLSTKEQKTASNQVLSALREIMNATTHTDESISRLSQISKEMSEISGKLSNTVGNFKV